MVLRWAFTLILLFGTILYVDAETGNYKWGLVRLSLASLRAEKSHSSELETQLFCGTPIRILDSHEDATDENQSSDWFFAETPDGYKAYIHRAAFVFIEPDEMSEWRSSPRVVLTDPLLSYVCADTISNTIISDVGVCCIFSGKKNRGGRYSQIRFPDGRIGYVPSESVEDFDEWINQPIDSNNVVKAALSLNGVPYLWGGVGSRGVDCSGLTQLSYFSDGVLLPRNASAQSLLGKNVEWKNKEPLLPGDLLFFLNDNKTKVVHVAISLGGSRYIHSSGYVHIASFDPTDFLFLDREVAFVKRIIHEDINQYMIRNHEWYVNKSN